MRQNVSPSPDRKAREITDCGCALKGDNFLFHCTDKLSDMLWAH